MTSCMSSSLDLSSLADSEEEVISELTDKELFNLVQETERTYDVLKIETKMFGCFLKRVNPNDAEIHQTTIIQPIAPEPNQRSFRKRSRSRLGGQTSDCQFKLTANQKCDIATRELEELREEIEISKETAQKKMDNFRAVMEEAGIRYAEVEKAQYEFNRDIVNGAVNPRTSKVIAEKLTRSMEEKLKSRDTLIEKLRLKNSTLKVQKKKVQLQLKQKEEMGEVLHEVDFNQLKIENNQYLEKIEERNQDLLRLKLMVTNVLQVLSTYKKKLHALTLESDRLRCEITMRKELLRKIENEEKLVAEEKGKVEDTNKTYRKNLADYNVPDVMDYVCEKSELYDMRKAVKSWERKVEIVSMALRSTLATWSRLRSSVDQPDPFNDACTASSNWNHDGASLQLT